MNVYSTHYPDVFAASHDSLHLNLKVLQQQILGQIEDHQCINSRSEQPSTDTTCGVWNSQCQTHARSRHPSQGDARRQLRCILMRFTGQRIPCLHSCGMQIQALMLVRWLAVAALCRVYGLYDPMLCFA